MSEQQFTHLPYNNGEFKGLYLPHDVARQRVERAGKSIPAPELVVPTDQELKESIARLDLGPLRNESPDDLKTEVLERNIDYMFDPKNILDLKASFDSRKEQIAQEPRNNPFQIADKDGSRARAHSETAKLLKLHLIDNYTQIGTKKDERRSVPLAVKSTIAELMDLSYEELEKRAAEVEAEKTPMVKLSSDVEGPAKPLLAQTVKGGAAPDDDPMASQLVLPGQGLSPASTATESGAVGEREAPAVNQEKYTEGRYKELVKAARDMVDELREKGINPSSKHINPDAIDELRGIFTRIAAGDQKIFDELVKKSHKDIFGGPDIADEIMRKVKAEVSSPGATEIITEEPKKLTYRGIGKLILRKALIWARLAEYQDAPISRSGMRKLAMATSPHLQIAGYPQTDRISRLVKAAEKKIMKPLRQAHEVGASHQIAAERGYNMQVVPVVEQSASDERVPQPLSSDELSALRAQKLKWAEDDKYPPGTKVIVKEDGTFVERVAVGKAYRTADGRMIVLVNPGSPNEVKQSISIPVSKLDAWAAEAQALEENNKELVTAF